MSSNSCWFESSNLSINPSNKMSAQFTFVYSMQVEELKRSHSKQEHKSAEAAVLQETVIGLEEQLADKNRVGHISS